MEGSTSICTGIRRRKDKLPFSLKANQAKRKDITEDLAVHPGHAPTILIVSRATS